MDDYISRQSTIQAIWVSLERDAKNACLDSSILDPEFCRLMARYNGIKAARKIIEKIPSADVRPVAHGNWIPKYEEIYCPENIYEHKMPPDYFECSICGHKEIRPEPYCNCGADMRGNKSE